MAKMSATDNNRRCPKCGGNLFIYNDYYGWYEQCLQCAYSRDLVEVCKAPTGGSHADIRVRM